MNPFHMNIGKTFAGLAIIGGLVGCSDESISEGRTEAAANSRWAGDISGTIVAMQADVARLRGLDTEGDAGSASEDISSNVTDSAGNKADTQPFDIAIAPAIGLPKSVTMVCEDTIVGVTELFKLMGKGCPIIDVQLENVDKDFEAVTLEFLAIQKQMMVGAKSTLGSFQDKIGGEPVNVKAATYITTNSLGENISIYVQKTLYTLVPGKMTYSIQQVNGKNQYLETFYINAQKDSNGSTHIFYITFSKDHYVPCVGGVDDTRKIESFSLDAILGNVSRRTTWSSGPNKLACDEANFSNNCMGGQSINVECAPNVNGYIGTNKQRPVDESTATALVNSLWSPMQAIMLESGITVD